MDISHLPWLLSYIPIYLILYLFTKHLLNKLKNLPPSPFLCLPFIGHLYLAKKPLYRTLSKVSDRHGPVVFLHLGSRPVLLITSPDAAEECLTKNDIVFANRPRILAAKHIGANYTSLAWSPYSDHWRNLRKISSLEILSTHRLESLGSIREDEVRSTIRELNRGAEGGRRVDMKATLFELTMNVVMRMIAGKKYYGVDVEDAKEEERFRAMTKETFKKGGSNIGDFLPVVKWLDLDGVEKRLRKLQRERNVFMQEHVEECKKRLDGARGGAKTMIEMLLELQKSDPEYYTDAFIRSLMLVKFFFFVNSD